MKLASTILLLVIATVFSAAQVTMVGNGAGATGGLKGVPFSADVVTEISRVFGDGTQLHQEPQGKFYRDSEGRTRTEDEIIAPSGTFNRVIIHDVVARTIITFDLRSPVATVHHTELHLRVPSAPSVEMAARQAKPSHASFDRQNLGTMLIEGFTVTGTRMTHTIEAGAIGNDKPLTDISETWFSPQLKTVLLSVSESPACGKRTRRLMNIQTTEPDPMLFQVPPDYTVRDDNPHQ